jgi:site-specific DNA-methyltransferase (adenine-specific)
MSKRGDKMIDLRCGDCLELMKTIPNKSIDMIFCDPPYGATQNKWDNIIDFNKLWEQCHRVIKDNGAMVFTGMGIFSAKLILSNAKNYRYSWCYEKSMPTGFLNANRMPLRAHEDVMVFYKKLPTYNPQYTKGKAYVRTKSNVATTNYGVFKQFKREYGDIKYPRSVVRFNTSYLRAHKTKHPTEKPVALCKYMIKTYTNENETVLDMCMGSGSTGVACVNTGRNFIGFEIDKDYYELAQNRISEATQL